MGENIKVKWRDELVQMGPLYWSNMVTGNSIYIIKEQIDEIVKTKKGKPKKVEKIKWCVRAFRPSDGQCCIQKFDTLTKAQKYAGKCAAFINDYYKCKKEELK